MRISVFGMGYVGCVSAACLSEVGHNVVAVEPNSIKLGMINQGKSPIVEKGLQELIENGIQAGRLHATTDCLAAVNASDVAIVCVGTPSNANGSIDLSAISRVSQEIGQALFNKKTYFTVVIRSTVTPGTMKELVIPTLEKFSGRKAGLEFGVCMNPEFLREGTAIHDFYNPPKTVIGELDPRSGDALAAIYQDLQAPLIRTDIQVAEMVKYADNTFHALKVCFANEIGNVCQALSIDSHKVMDIFCKDTKLNLSPYYLKPGFAFGGSCLPKDVRSISYQAKRHDVDIPLLGAILDSNKHQIQKVITKLVTFKGRSLGFLGLSFKEGTDDLRESPIVEVIETMIGKGFTVHIHDGNVSLAKLIGANKQYIEKEIPHVSELLCGSADELIEKSDVLVLASREKQYYDRLRSIRGRQVILDLVRMFGPDDHPPTEYYGICW